MRLKKADSPKSPDFSWFLEYPAHRAMRYSYRSRRSETVWGRLFLWGRENSDRNQGAFEKGYSKTKNFVGP
ncbi:MAG TPA: hypothetical protein DEV98_06315 [Clostridiales bacterium]|nr:hypothetical protein [Clostridiales bacterium]